MRSLTTVLLREDLSPELQPALFEACSSRWSEARELLAPRPARDSTEELRALRIVCDMLRTYVCLGGAAIDPALQTGIDAARRENRLKLHLELCSLVIEALLCFRDDAWRWALLPEGERLFDAHPREAIPVARAVSALLMDLDTFDAGAPNASLHWRRTMAQEWPVATRSLESCLGASRWQRVVARAALPALSRRGNLQNALVVRHLGPSMLEPLIAEASRPTGSRDWLAPIAAASLRAEDVPRLEELARDPAGKASFFAIEALGASRIPEAFPVLQALAREAGPHRRRAAVSALGNYGDPRALEELRQVATTLLPDGDAAGALDAASTPERIRDLHLLLAVVEACFKLGDPCLGHLAVTLAGHEGSADQAGRLEVRIGAARALWVVAAPGMVPALGRVAALDGDALCAAATALHHLGTPSVIPLLLRAAELPEQGIQALSCAVALLGAPEGSTLDGAREHFAAHGQELAPHVCHRAGRPLVIPDLVTELTKLEYLDYDERLDLQNLTGHDFRLADAEACQVWLDGVETPFQTGVLYKWGRAQNLRDLEAGS